ncbi:MAG: hypothetical protein HUU50_20600 [Candidatus Brocadiae bacterium]|nr:hypothetical protein [Candidatus Brocadiia bacterium]
MDKINKVMTTSEIDKKFNKKWVLVKNPTIKNGYMKGGLVLFSGGRKELLDKAKELRLRSSAFFRAGEITEPSIHFYT